MKEDLRKRAIEQYLGSRDWPTTGINEVQLVGEVDPREIPGPIRVPFQRLSYKEQCVARQFAESLFPEE